MQNYNIDNDRAVVDLWETHTIGIDGMTCEQCVKTLTRGLKSVNGIKDVKVDLNDATATVTYDTTKTDIPAIHDAILAAGYKPTKQVPK
jgi:copper chaperone CopZ